MINVFEISDSGKALVRVFDSYEAAKSYILHPANSRRNLVISAAN